MSIGDTFPYSVVTVGTPSWGGSVNQILDELISRTATSVPFSALSGSTLAMGNVPVSAAKYVGFTEQSISPGASPVGRIEYYNGNFYMVTTSGTIQITSGAGLNAASIGGIGGDYGGGNTASVRFDDASTRYDFYDSYTGTPGVDTWAYIHGRSIDISAGATSANYARIVYGTAANVTITLPALPTANRPMFIDNTGAITTGHGDTIEKVTLTCPINVSGGPHLATSISSVTSSASGGYILGISPTVGRRLKGFTASVLNASGIAAQITLRTLTNADAATDIAVASSAAGAGLNTWTGTAGTPHTVVTGNRYYLVISVGTGDSLKNLEFTYDYLP